METKNIQTTFNKFFVRKKFKTDKRFIVFLIFVLISTIFWLLNQLEKEYETEVTFPVRYINFPKDKILVNDLPKNFNIRVQGFGYRLVEYKISNTFLPFVVDVNKLTLKLYSRRDYVKLYSLTRNLSDKIEQQISSELQILAIQPDTLFFDFADRINKKVQVISKINAVPATQYMIKNDIKINPDSIIISGAYPIIDTIDQVHTQKIDLNNLSKDYLGNVALQKIENVDFSDQEVEIFISVEKFTEGNVKVPLKVKNVPDSLILRTFPNEISISYFIALSNYDKVLPQFFEAVVDYKDLNRQNSKVKVKVTNSPEYVRSLRFYPQTVEYLIERK